jgi:microsomal epoxide hydrolase
MRGLVDYWLHRYDWRKEERTLNQFDQFKADVHGLGVHYIHEQGRGPNPVPLLLLHGFPWSVAMFTKIIPLLTDPAARGGDAADSFTVVAPSLVGFGFSDAPTEQGFQFVKQADYLRDLMVEVLGYKRFGVQGGDWGGIICTPLGYKYPQNVIGLSQNYMGVTIRQEHTPAPDEIRGHGMETAPLRPSDPETLKFWKTFENWCDNEGGYRHIQMTRPQTLAYSMCDSPAGLAAWIVEKQRAWSDCGGDVEKVFSKDEIITNVMLYWLECAFSSAIRIYYETKHHPWKLKPGDCVTAPAAFTAFPREHTPVLKSRAEAYYSDIRRFTNMKRGGHFAAFECPEDLAGEVRAFFRPLRQGA